MSRLVLISNKHCDANDIVAAANDYSLTDWVDEHQGVWLGWNGDVQTFAEAEYRPIDDHQRDGYQFVTFPFSAREFHYHYQGLLSRWAMAGVSPAARTRALFGRKLSGLLSD
ncbi:trehalose-6-phosphate synthase [Serratia odorifera]|uniref:Trehalose-6-phosphate synthase n=1 Tax=Serratia odorifera TaxID=618 RepID=A0A447KML6_SEROD|nr:hypothetical protein [Serratia odorifera]VDZ53155.1 trehalose-6-phosphate synthase [Serratia odorifera]